MEAKIKIIGGVLGIVVAVIALWGTLGFPVPALKTQLEALTKAYIATTLCNDNGNPECKLREDEKDRLKSTLKKIEDGE